MRKLIFLIFACAVFGISIAAQALSKAKFPAYAVSTNNDGTLGDFKISGSFRLRKRLE